MHVFSAVMLAALLLCASGAPIEDGSVAGDFSGEETEEAEMSTVKPFNIWRSLFDSAQEYEKAVRACSLTMINRCHQVRLGFSRTPGTLKYFRVPAYLSLFKLYFNSFLLV